MRIVKKVRQIGLRKTMYAGYNRVKTNLHQTYVRKQALNKKAHTSWDYFQKQCGNKSFEEIFNVVRTHNFTWVQELVRHESHEQYLQQAYDSVEKKIALLGAEKCSYGTIPWHTDIRLYNAEYSTDTAFNSNLFYKDIKIIPSTTQVLTKDIKLPWELSRFQFLLPLGYAYQQKKDAIFAETFSYYLQDWLTCNPYLLGANWACPMDVAIRALNWIVGFSFFADAAIEQTLWQDLLCSLYDHMRYLENNWELYDSRTSNHYLSDLVGYLALCYFFKPLFDCQKQLEWCFAEILAECKKQIFPEGASYEGSTKYHGLVTELFIIAERIARYVGLGIPDWFLMKLESMQEFNAWCCVNECESIQIGDNDSGKIIDGLAKNSKYKDLHGVQHYPLFGISFLKHAEWHISLRHHVYNKLQPSGHFHSDAASITLAYKGIPLFIDPGSYVYTPSVVWRNLFRSMKVHNTFMLKNREPIEFDEHLFSLALPENKTILHDDLSMQLRTRHELYAELGLQAERIITFDDEKTVLIADCWKKANELSKLVSCWHFMLHPRLEVYSQDGSIIIVYNEKPLWLITSNNLHFVVQESWYSPEYGVKEKTCSLYAERLIDEQIIQTKIMAIE